MLFDSPQIEQSAPLEPGRQSDLVTVVFGLIFLGPSPQFFRLQGWVGSGYCECVVVSVSVVGNAY